MFAKKDRPDDFVFPACKICNEISRNSDLVISFLSLSTMDGKFEGDTESQQMATAIKNNCPQTLYEMQTSRLGTRAREKRAKEITGDNWVVLKIGPYTRAHINLVARKMTSAGYYRLTQGKILPPTANIYIHVATQMNIIEERMPDFSSFPLGEYVTLRQGRKEVGTQFGFRGTVSVDQGIGLFQFYLQNQFLVTSFVIRDREKFESLDERNKRGYKLLCEIQPLRETPLTPMQRLSLW